MCVTYVSTCICVYVCLCVYIYTYIYLYTERYNNVFCSKTTMYFDVRRIR